MNFPDDIRARLAARYGFDLGTLGPGALRAAWRRRREATKSDSDFKYHRMLIRSDAELAEFAEELLVPESWFFRDCAPFAFLETWVRRDWLPRARGRALRVLSIPCSAGQEPYSIAMSLLDAGLAPDKFLVWAGDVSVRSLALARAGEYPASAFRGRDAAGRDHHFEAVGANRRRVRENVRACVQFHECNLLDPDFARGEAPFDAVFCRNVLIYFDAAARARVLDNLRRCLAPGGILFTGHADSLPVLTPDFVTAGTPGSFAFQRRETVFTPAAPPPSPRKRTGRTRQPMPETKTAQPALSQTPATFTATAPAPTPPGPGALADARRLADAGLLDQAGERCRELLQAAGPQPEAYFLLGQLAAARGRPGEAENLFRKTLYLDANHRDALTQLALLSDRRGDSAAAARLRRRITSE